jgi:N-acyl-D-aspartate/D-glutamate deacylase
MLNNVKLTVAALILGMAMVSTGLAQDYDLVIEGGRVIDPETKFDSVANVGIKDGVIAVVTEGEINGKQTIDATGKIVSPGFIDLHSHGLKRCQALHGAHFTNCNAFLHNCLVSFMPIV